MNRERKLLFKISLLSSSILLTGVNAVSAILPELQAVYSGSGKAVVQQFITAPAIAQMLACILCGILASRFGKKRMLLMGCICFMAGGFAPMLVTSLPAKIGLRLILGAGIGLIQPLSASMISDFFQGNERDGLMGIQSAAVGMGGIIMTFIVSCIINMDWTKCYWVYCLGLPVLLMSAFYIPDVKGKNAGAQGKAVKKSIPSGAVAMGVFQFIFTVALQSIFISLSYAVVDNGIGTPGQAGFMLTVYSIVGLLGGLLFGKAYKVLGRNIGPMALIMIGIPFLFIGTVLSMPVYYVCIGAAGLGFSWFMPFTIVGSTENATAENSSVGTSVVFAASGLGGFLAAYILDGMGRIFGNTSSTFSFILCGITQIGLAVVLAVYLKVNKLKHNAVLPDAGAADYEMGGIRE